MRAGTAGEQLKDSDLQQAINNAEQGLIDADLGGGVIKQRIACNGRGKSGGFRTIILFKKQERAFFVHGYAKNEKSNIEDYELKAFKNSANVLIHCSDAELDKLINSGKMIEVK
jgi:hypothetical protein